MKADLRGSARSRSAPPLVVGFDETARAAVRRARAGSAAQVFKVCNPHQAKAKVLEANLEISTGSREDRSDSQGHQGGNYAEEHEARSQGFHDRSDRW